MPNDPSNSEVTRSLARAFDRAWEQYYLPGRITISADVGRKQLAKRLVELAREGERNESALAAGGLAHLVSLTPLLLTNMTVRHLHRDSAEPGSHARVVFRPGRYFFPPLG
jgi:hypothetical protein